ncbi:MAG: hypothetical protein LBD82_06435 [Deltaproteobacteria bacterium]|nr:hypothetical protein [Deltaproteobacteria bacterium]
MNDADKKTGHQAAALRDEGDQPRHYAGAPDPSIPWRGFSSPPQVEQMHTGVLHEGEKTDAPDPPPEAGGSCALCPVLEAKEAPCLEEQTDYELVLGVKFRQYGPVYFFRAGHERIGVGGKVLVETEQGMSLAEVISARKMRLPLQRVRTADGTELEIKPIKGLAGAEDIAAAVDNNILASGARLFCGRCIRERGLEMKLVDVEVLHDRSKIIFYFTAPGRIDFRALVKDLVHNYRTRIELRQIGVRHETQMLGALGNCGMACCCRRYLRRFAPVTIKMAKEQNLFLNPAKLSGICGRLLCCLANEQENYEEFHRSSPKLGKKYQTSQGIMKVLRTNLFQQSIVALNEAGEEHEFMLDAWRDLNPARLESKPEAGGGAPRKDAEAKAEVEEIHKQAEGHELESPDLYPPDQDMELESLQDREDELYVPSPWNKSGVPDAKNKEAAGKNQTAPHHKRGHPPHGHEPAAGLGDDSIFGLPGSRYTGQKQPALKNHD